MILFVPGLFDYASLKIIVYRKISELLTDSDSQFYKNILENGAQQSIWKIIVMPFFEYIITLGRKFSIRNQ